MWYVLPEMTSLPERTKFLRLYQVKNICEEQRIDTVNP